MPILDDPAREVAQILKGRLGPWAAKLPNFPSIGQSLPLFWFFGLLLDDLFVRFVLFTTKSTKSGALTMRTFVSFVLLFMTIFAACANFSGAEDLSDSDIPLAKTQRREVRKRGLFLNSLRLSAFARDIPNFGWGVTALGFLWCYRIHCKTGRARFNHHQP
jgi:hypothetical protein